ncbi:MAG: Cell division protein ftsA [Candidatus Roizmanbacteria bacterium GW2011_GWA2_33_33]|uniref:Cell division protein ftsA n=1 Tax=Candidatus Roizmanbacteria bacterium GW2011_GWA2_33_33 TaxID=1618476 RepID=A0A0G0D5D7_9BACT|nr:MAG: Cell division protein ftsA [Candidatus Roizmanbacteria bacterium GW2011_GWA2_33_33]
MTDNLICGIDIGSSKIATVVGMDSAETDELKIIGFNTTVARGVRRGLVVDIKEATEAVESGGN